MAKSRSKKSRGAKTRKAAASSSRARAKRGGAKKAKTSKARRTTRAKKDVLNLKALRRDLERAVAALGRKTSRDPDGQRALDTAQESLTRWIAEADEFCTPEMQEICGPTMEIPLGA